MCDLCYVIHMVFWFMLQRYPVWLWIVSPWSLNGSKRRQPDRGGSGCRRSRPL